MVTNKDNLFLFDGSSTLLRNAQWCFDLAISVAMPVAMSVAMPVGKASVPPHDLSLQFSYCLAARSQSYTKSSAVQHSSSRPDFLGTQR